MKFWSVTFSVFLAAMIGTTFACWAVWAFMLNPTAAAVKTATRLHERIINKFPVSPSIYANACALFAPSNRSEELVLLETNSTVRETLDGLLPQAVGLTIESAFTAKTGIRSRETFRIDVRSGGLMADCNIPTPRIISLELIDPKVLQPHGMPWESLPEKTRLRAVRALERGAKRLIEERRIPQESRRAFEARLTSILQSVHCEAVFPHREIP